MTIPSDEVSRLFVAIFELTQRIEFCYGHRLLDYNGKCAHPHGHTAVAELTFHASKLDKRGMVLDFSDIKKITERWIDEHLDHKMLLRKNDPLVTMLQEMKEPIYIMDGNPTAENIAKEIYQQAKKNGLPILEVRLWRNSTQFATYRK